MPIQSTISRERSNELRNFSHDGMPTSGGQAVTGLTNEMTPGDITELAQSDKVAFRGT